jgi:ssRNA-specific RNase YbeY (16S rRNA maturation enzyme)
LFVHGLLHLLKFNHESASGYKQMTQLQDLILSKLNFNITIE